MNTTTNTILLPVTQKLSLFAHHNNPHLGLLGSCEYLLREALTASFAALGLVTVCDQWGRENSEPSFRQHTKTNFGLALHGVEEKGKELSSCGLLSRRMHIHSVLGSHAMVWLMMPCQPGLYGIVTFCLSVIFFCGLSFSAVFCMCIYFQVKGLLIKSPLQPPPSSKCQKIFCPVLDYKEAMTQAKSWYSNCQSAFAKQAFPQPVNILSALLLSTWFSAAKESFFIYTNWIYSRLC